MIDLDMGTEPRVLSGPEPTELERAFAEEREQAEQNVTRSQHFIAMRQAAMGIAAHAIRYEAQRDDLQSRRSRFTSEGFSEEHRKLRTERDQVRRELISKYEAAEAKLRYLGSPANADQLLEDRGEPVDARDASRMALEVSLADKLAPEQFVEKVIDAAQQRDRPLLAVLLPLAHHYATEPRFGPHVGHLQQAIGLGEEARLTSRTRTKAVAGEVADQSRTALRAYMVHVDKNGATERVELETVYGHRLPNWLSLLGPLAPEPEGEDR
jgi:hypothetical protein